jgi:hypothetical protein
MGRRNSVRLFYGVGLRQRYFRTLAEKYTKRKRVFQTKGTIMSAMKSSVVVLLLVLCFSIPNAKGDIAVTPGNFTMPVSAGGLFSFDLLVSDPMGKTANTFQATITYSGPGTLTFNAAESLNVKNNASYWVYGNSMGASAVYSGSNTCYFGDSPDNPASEALVAGDVLARYAFNWDGTVGDYTFSLDLNTQKSFVVTTPTYNTETLIFNRGNLLGGDSNFVASIPEPATLLLAAAGIGFLRKRK